MPEWLIGIWPALLVLALLSGGLFWLARRQQIRGKWLGSPHRASISWLGGYTEAFQRVLDLIPEIGAEILDADPNHGYVVAAKGGSLRTFGTTIRINLLTQEGVTFVQIDAGPSASLFDWGESRSLVTRFLQLWDRLPSPIAA